MQLVEQIYVHIHLWDLKWSYTVFWDGPSRKILDADTNQVQSRYFDFSFLAHTI